MIYTDSSLPIKGLPVGRIEYLDSSGTVGESIEFDDEEKLISAILYENYYGSPMNVVLYRDENGKTIDQDFIEKLDPPNIGLKITDIPDYLLSDDAASCSDEEMSL